MAGDIPLHEQVLVGERPSEGLEAPLGAGEAPGLRVVHTYGKRVHILGSTRTHASLEPVPAGVHAKAAEVPREVLGGLDPGESLGLAALRLRQSSAYQAAKQQRPREGEPWAPRGSCTEVTPFDRQRAAAPKVALPWSAFMAGRVAVGLIIVSGPTPDLQFSDAEVLKVTAEVQNGLSWFPAVSPAAGLSFIHDPHHVHISTPANPGAADLERVWRDPAMGALGYEASSNGVVQYIEALRTLHGTRWTYCAFFTKYPVGIPDAYASLGGPRLVVGYPGSWGVDNIDRVFAHETSHIFQCPDEYAPACTCGGTWGRYGAPDDNCESCAPGGSVSCLMRNNTWEVCRYTPLHLGFPAPWQMLQSDAYVGLGNLTGNGKAQVLVRTHGTGAGVQRAATLRQVGGGTGLEVGWTAVTSLPGGWTLDVSDVFLALGDVDGDGKSEVLVQSRRAGAPAIALLRYEGRLGGPRVSRVMTGELPGHWKMNVGDVYLPLGDIDGDGKAEVLVRSQYTGNRYVGLLRYDASTQGLRSVWIVQDIIGRWRMNQSDAYLMAGDLDGDGRTELIVRSQYEGIHRHIGLLRFDASTQGLQSTWITENTLPGGWKMNQSDAYLMAGDLDGDGKSELVVRSQYLGPRYLGLLRYSPLTRGLQADGIFQNTLPGGWNMRLSDLYLLAGDLDGNGRPELVVQSRQAGDCYLGVVRYELGTRRLLAEGILQNTVPGGWRMNPTDAYLLAGDVEGDGRSELLVRSQYVGDSYLGLLRYDPSAGALSARWITQGVIPGSSAMAEALASPSPELPGRTAAVAEAPQPHAP